MKLDWSNKFRPPVIKLFTTNKNLYYTQKNKLSHGANPASDKFLSAADNFIYHLYFIKNT
jgi:hypothetical protein